MNILDAIDACVAHMRLEGKASTTQYDTRMDLRRVARVLAGLGIDDVRSITPEVVMAVADSWRDSKPRSRGRYGVSLRRFLAFLTREGLVDEAAYQAVPSTSLPLATVYTVPAADTLRRVVESAAPGTRERALMELLALGVNPYECCKALLTDFDGKKGAITIGCGTKRRTIELPTTAWACLTAYIEQGRTKYATPTAKGLFLNQYGKAVSRMVPWNALRYASETTGIPVTSRMLKAARVASLLKNNSDPQAVAREVGMTAANALRYKFTQTEGVA